MAESPCPSLVCLPSPQVYSAPWDVTHAVCAPPAATCATATATSGPRTWLRVRDGMLHGMMHGMMHGMRVRDGMLDWS